MKDIEQLCELYDDFVFDLDDTLYAEADYLTGAYKEIGTMLAGKYQLPAGDFFRFLEEDYRKGLRSGLFDRLISHFGLPPGEMEHMLQVLRTFTPQVSFRLLPGVPQLFQKLISSGKQICILTNGNVKQQENKIRHIDWEGYRDHLFIVYANTHTPKPDPAPWHFLVSSTTVTRPVYIGDSENDRLFAMNCEIPFLFTSELI